MMMISPNTMNEANDDIMECYPQLHSLIHDINANDKDIRTEINLNYDYLNLDDDDVVFEEDYDDDDENDETSSDFDRPSFNECIGTLCNAIAQNESIEKVQLFWDFMQHVTIENRSKLCQAIQKLSKLKHLSIFHGDEEFAMSDFIKIIESKKDLETLDLNNIEFTGDSQEFMQLCDTMRRNCPKLKEVLLYNVLFESQKDMDPFMMTLSQLPALESIQIQTDFEEPEISKQALCAICQIPSLKNLRLESYDLSTKMVTGVAEGLCLQSNIERLFLSGGKDLEYASVMAIANALQHNTKLQELRLAFENSSCLHTYPDACTAFENAMSKNSTLKGLTMDGMSFIPDRSMANILRSNSTLEKLCLTNYCMERFVESAEALGAYNTTLKILQLPSNFLQPDSGFAIAKMLRTNSSLTALDLADNTMGEAACIEIASSLKSSNQTLENLNINNNLDIVVNVDNDFYEKPNEDNCGAIKRLANAFITALDQNSKIKTLYLEDGFSDSFIPSTYAAKLNFYLKMNACGRHAFLQNLDHMSNEKYLQNLSKVTHNYSQLFYILREKPSPLVELSLSTKIRQRENNDDDLESLFPSNKRMKLC